MTYEELQPNKFRATYTNPACSISQHIDCIQYPITQVEETTVVYRKCKKEEKEGEK